MAEEVLPENTWVVPVSEMLSSPKEKQPLTEAQRRAILMASLEDRRGGAYRRTPSHQSSVTKGLSADILSNISGIRPMGSISMPRKMDGVEASGVSPISASFIYQPMGGEGPQNSGISPNVDIPSEYAYGDGFSFLLSPEAGGMDPKDYPKDEEEPNPSQPSLGGSQGLVVSGGSGGSILPRGQNPQGFRRDTNQQTYPSAPPVAPTQERRTDTFVPSAFTERTSSLPRGAFRQITQSGFDAVPADQLYIVRESEPDGGMTHLMSWEGIAADVVRYERHLFWSQVGGFLLGILKGIVFITFLITGIYYFRREIAVLLLRGRIYLRFR